MNDKIWSEYDLQKRDDLADKVAQSIATTKHPRQHLNLYIRDLIKYEILPNIVANSLSDDDIRQLAKRNISTPRRLSKAANYDYYNKFPSLDVEQCIMLLIDVEPGTPIRTQVEKDQYDRVIKLAVSFGRAKQKPFADWHVGSFTNYQIDPTKFIEWARSMGEEPPERWQPIREEPIVKGGPRYNEAVLAANKMRDDAEIPTPTKLDDLYQYMIGHADRFPVNCGPNSFLKIENIKRQVHRDGGNPLKDPRFLSDSDN